MSSDRWLILADDLTGAADTAIAFARRGWRASVEWGAATPDAEVLALDAETRDAADPAIAAERHAGLIRAHRGGRGQFFKKIDSTLRGHPAAELTASLRELDAVALVAPAFPTQGRTTLGGRVHLHGRPLEASALWAREHSYARADLREIFALDGVSARHASLDELHDGRLPALIEAALREGGRAVVCDAFEERDLSLIAHAARPFDRRLLWVGSAGLAHAIAGGMPRHGEPPARPSVAGGILVVVGSLAEASQAGVSRLMEEGDVRVATVSPAMLRGGPEAWKATREAVQGALVSGQDVLVTIAGQDGIDPRLVRDLGALLLDARLGGLIATGGGTARALLAGQGATSMTLLDEVEPGVPLGLANHLPVITKAGAFGDAGTLGRCLAHLRRLRATEIPA